MKHAALALSFICALTFAICAAEDLDPTALNQAVQEKLKKPITVDFKAQPLNAAFKTISDAIGVKIFFDPKLKSREATPVTLRAVAMPAEDVLRALAKQLQVEFGVRQGIVFVTETFLPGPAIQAPPPPFLVPDANEPRWKTDLRDQLNRKKITFHFTNEFLDKVVAKVAEMSQVRIKVVPRPGDPIGTISLRVTDIPLATALYYLAILQDYEVQLKETGVEIAKARP